MNRPPPMKLIKIGEEWLATDRDRNEDGSLRSQELDQEEPLGSTDEDAAASPTPLPPPAPTER
jgi:hypothetical protein